MQDDGRRDIARPTMGNKNRKYEFKKTVQFKLGVKGLSQL